MAPESKPKSNFRQFFLRGLGILLPTVLTIWILVAVFQFVDQKIAQPINRGVQELILLSPWPDATPEQVSDYERSLTPEQRAEWRRMKLVPAYVQQGARRAELQRAWNRLAIGAFVISDLVGLLIAVVLIYIVGAVLGSMIGRGMYHRLEARFRRLPVVKAVYPHVKQVTDFLFGDEKTLKFNNVVAVQYPRAGIWSLGLLTGDTMRDIESQVGERCVTIFIPSSPTPFTGYVITVPWTDCIELPISIDDALRFVVSGGVIVPESQTITPAAEGEAPAVLTVRAGGTGGTGGAGGGTAIGPNVSGETKMR